MLKTKESDEFECLSHKQKQTLLMYHHQILEDIGFH